MRLAGIGNHVITEEPIGKIKVCSLFCQSKQIDEPFELLQTDFEELKIGKKDLDISGNSQELGQEWDPKLAELTDEQLDAEIEKALLKQQQQAIALLNTIKEDDEDVSSSKKSGLVPDSNSDQMPFTIEHEGKSLFE